MKTWHSITKSKKKKIMKTLKSSCVTNRVRAKSNEYSDKTVRARVNYWDSARQSESQLDNYQ